MADRELPRFNDAIADMLDGPSVIKMRFPQVGMRFYPLRADIVRLQRVCDTYLNFTNEPDDRPPVCFRPAAPFVLMQTVNYDKLEIEQLGWLVQHEAIFSIPLEWYERQGDRWVFKDWAMTYPFIYLDHPISIWIGREMYGWPKVPARVPRLFPLRNPPDPQGRVAFNLATHSRNRPDQPEPFRPFIEIRQEADGLSAVPWSAGGLYSCLPRAITGGLAAASTMADALSDFFLRKPRGGSVSEPYAAMMGRGFEYAGKWLPEFLTMMVPGMARERQNFTASPFMRNNIVLKQFRDAHQINSACYQALVKSEISVNEIIDAGLLFNPLSGDASGGITIRLHRFDTQPIVETLGLDVSGIVTERGETVTSLKPFCPFWWNLDLSYGDASTICWRSRTTRFSATPEPGPKATGIADYVKLGSGALEEIAGVEDFPKFLMRVLPLKANPQQLARLCRDLFDNTPYIFEPVAPYVLMIADQFREMEAETEPKQRWADSELTFAVVANCREQSNPAATRLVILPLIGFVGSEWNAISNREVTGWFTLASDFVAPPGHGMQHLPPTGKDPLRRLFSLRTSICPTLDENEQTRRWTLIELAEDTGVPAHPRESLEDWLGELGLAAVAKERRFESVALKQFRDAAQADRACYQALVLLERNFTGPQEIRWIEERLKVTIHQFDTMQIVKKFGLVGGEQKLDRNGRPCAVFDPIKPFWVRGDIRQGLGVNLCWRASVMDWQRDEIAK